MRYFKIMYSTEKALNNTMTVKADRFVNEALIVQNAKLANIKAGLGVVQSVVVTSIYEFPTRRDYEDYIAPLSEIESPIMAPAAEA
jgi:hypothetical protein